MGKRTREYSAWWGKDQSHKRREYNNNPTILANREKAAREENERILTLEMLLGAKYAMGRFIKTMEDDHGNRSYRYFDSKGVEIDRHGQPLGE